METLKKIGSAVLTFTFALGGMGIGAVTGALQGQTSETGMVRGTIIGAVAGAVVAIDFLESCLHGELLSKVALFGSLLNGKIFREWVTPSIMIAYQSQANTQETSYADTSDIFDISGSRGLHLEMISNLPQMKITGFEVADPCGDTICCAVCLQDFKWGEDARRLPACGHFFHMLCIDRWLQSHGSCPFCRREVHPEALKQLRSSYSSSKENQWAMAEAKWMEGLSSVCQKQWPWWHIIDV